VVKR
jgi:hypothetical protein